MILRHSLACLALAFSLFGLGCMPPSFLVTPVANTEDLVEQTVQSGQGWFPKKILVLEVEGLLLNAQAGGFLQPKENAVSLFAQQLRKAEKDPEVRAVVLRINSPGGTVSASDLLYEEILRFKKNTGRPVIASAQEIAASGGYYVACAADQIVVQPTSVVGSIGVIFNTFDFSGTLAKIGARSEAIKSGGLKDMGSPLKPLTDPERQVMQQIINDYFLRFQDVVKTARQLDEAQLAAVSDGRIFTGQQAAAHRLADRTGFLEDAIQLAKDRAHQPGAKVVLYKRPYGYGGSIYARQPAPQPQANLIHINLLPPTHDLPSGFYYLWQP